VIPAIRVVIPAIRIVIPPIRIVRADDGAAASAGTNGEDEDEQQAA
jgi:hypothetical protein